MWYYPRNVAKKYVFLLDEMALLGISVMKAKCALERFFIYCPVPLLMNVAIPKKCSKGVYIFFSDEMTLMGCSLTKTKCEWLSSSM
jgi:hypothetical protein